MKGDIDKIKTRLKDLINEEGGLNLTQLNDRIDDIQNMPGLATSTLALDAEMGQSEALVEDTGDPSEPSTLSLHDRISNGIKKFRIDNIRKRLHRISDAV